MPRDASNWHAASRARPSGVPTLSFQWQAREGRYWLVGDVRNTPGRSHVRAAPRSRRRDPPASGPTPQPANMAISSTSSARARACVDFREVAEEARRFLELASR